MMSECTGTVRRGPAARGKFWRGPPGSRQAKGYGNMAFTNEYLQGVYADVTRKDPDQPEFLQAVREVLESLQPVIERRPELVKAGVMPRIVEPERSLAFRVSWVDDKGRVQVNRG